MANDWIKMRQELFTHPRFLALTRELVYGNDSGILLYACGDALDAVLKGDETVTDIALRHVTEVALRDVAMCALLRVWCAVNAHSKVFGTDACCDGIDLLDLDSIAGFPGFGGAMAAVGWVRQEDCKGLVFPNFLEFNEPACLRASALTGAQRQARHRERKRAELMGNGVRVTKSNASNGREEKRREELGDESPKTPLARSCEDAASVPEGGEPGRRNQPTKNDAVAMTFPVVGTERGVAVHEWRLTAAAVADYAEAYPGLDVVAECRKALQWVKSDPGRRKTARGMPRFLNGWLSRATNTGRGQKLSEANPSPPRAETPIQRLARQRREEESCHRQTTLPGLTGTPPPSA